MSNLEKTTKKVSLKTLKEQVEKGMKKEELAKFYNLPVAQVTKMLKAAGLKIRKFHEPAFELINDEFIEEPIVSENQEVSNENVIEEKDNEEITQESTVNSEEKSNLAPTTSEEKVEDLSRDIAPSSTNLQEEDTKEEAPKTTLGDLWS